MAGLIQKYIRVYTRYQIWTVMCSLGCTSTASGGIPRKCAYRN